MKKIIPYNYKDKCGRLETGILLSLTFLLHKSSTFGSARWPDSLQKDEGRKRKEDTITLIVLKLDPPIIVHMLINSHFTGSDDMTDDYEHMVAEDYFMILVILVASSLSFPRDIACISFTAPLHVASGLVGLKHLLLTFA